MSWRVDSPIAQLRGRNNTPHTHCVSITGPGVTPGGDYIVPPGGWISINFLASATVIITDKSGTPQPWTLVSQFSPHLRRVP